MDDDDDRYDPQGERDRRDKRWSTWAGLGGIVLLGLAIGLTMLHAGGLVLPTIMGIAGVGALLAGVVSGAVSIGNAYRRSDSDFDR